MDKRINFTQKAIDALPIPETGKRYYFYDTKIDGLEVMVTHNGIKSFKVYRKFEGKPVRVTLGKYPTLTVEQARNKAKLVNADFARGINPNEEKKRVSNEYTFRELFDRYVEDYAKPNGNKSWEEDVKDVNRNLSHWFKKKISTISKDEISRLHADFGNKRGIYGANRLLDRINAIFNKATEWGWEGTNPAKGVKKFRMQSRDRFLQATELPAFFQALQEEENEVAKDYILISLLTGARKGNVLAMRWEQINFQEKTWRIPETKNREPLTIPLAPQAIEILAGRRKATNSAWVFPSGTSQSGHLQDPKKAWKRLLQRAEIFQLIDHIGKAKKWNELSIAQEKEQAKDSLQKSLETYREAARKQGIETIGISDLRLHDLRRSLGSWQAATGATTAIIGKSLGHKSPRATAVYERLNIDPVRDSVETAANALFEAGKLSKKE